MSLTAKTWAVAVLPWVGTIALDAATASVSSLAASPKVDPKILHVLNRLSVDHRPGDVPMVPPVGGDRYIESNSSARD